MGGNWIAGAIKHPGALHAQLGIPQGQKIPRARLLAAAKSPGLLGRRARLALTLEKMHGGGGDPPMTPARNAATKLYNAQSAAPAMGTQRKAMSKSKRKGIRFGKRGVPAGAGSTRRFVPGDGD